MKAESISDHRDRVAGLLDNNSGIAAARVGMDRLIEFYEAIDAATSHQEIDDAWRSLWREMRERRGVTHAWR